MSYFEYKTGLRLEAEDTPFYGLIQAAMRRADGDNLARLRREWPQVWEELNARFNAPGGRLPGEEDR